MPAKISHGVSGYSTRCLDEPQGQLYDNAFIESFWSSLKYEVVWPRKFATRDEARTAVFDDIESFYNRTRLHSSLGYARKAKVTLPPLEDYEQNVVAPIVPLPPAATG